MASGDGNGGHPKECRLDMVAVECAGGAIVLGYPIYAKPPPPPPHPHIPKCHLPAVVVVAETTARVGADIPVDGRRDPASALDHFRSSIQRHDEKLCHWRGCMIMVFVILFLVVGGITFSYLEDPLVKDPIVRVRDFAVSNLSISDHGPMALTATITVVNPNSKRTLHLKDIQSFVYPDDAYNKRLYMMSSVVEPLFMEKKSPASVAFRTTANITGSDSIAKDDLEENINRGLLDSGTVSFSLGIYLKEELQLGNNNLHDNIDTDVETIHCKGLTVAFQFSGNVSVETLSTDNPSGEVQCKRLPLSNERSSALL